MMLYDQKLTELNRHDFCYVSQLLIMANTLCILCVLLTIHSERDDTLKA